MYEYKKLKELNGILHIRLHKLGVSHSIIILSMVSLASLSGTYFIESSAFSPDVIHYNSGPVLYNIAGREIDSLQVGEEAAIRISITNNNREEQSVVIIVEVRHGSGITTYLAWQGNTIAGNANYTFEVAWRPDSLCPNVGCNDNYSIRSFAITGFDNPSVLSVVRVIDGITVIASRDEVYSDVDESDGRETAVYALLASDPSLAKYREDVYGHAEDFTPLRKEPSGAWVDEAIMHVIREQVTAGDWQSGYTITFKGLMDVKMEIRSARDILSIEEIPKQDQTDQYTFDEKDKRVIRTALNNESVVEALKSKEQAGHSTYVTGVFYNGFITNPESDCPARECARVHFQVENAKQVMVIWLNTNTDKVVRLDFSTEWKRDCRQFECIES